MKQLHSLPFVGLAVFAFSQPAAAAPILLDDFSLPGTKFVYAIPFFSPNPTARVDAIPGATRTTTIQMVSNPVSPFAASGNVGGGNVSLSTAVSETALLAVSYLLDGPLNISSFYSFELDFDAMDVTFPLSVSVYDVNGNSSTVVTAVNAATTIRVLLAGFTGIDLTQVDRMKFVLNRDVLQSKSTVSADFQLDSIVIGEIPEPGAAWLVLCGIPLILFGRRRRPNQ